MLITLEDDQPVGMIIFGRLDHLQAGRLAAGGTDTGVGPYVGAAVVFGVAAIGANRVDLVV